MFMRTHNATTAQPAGSQYRHVGVGIDTSRYGHYAAFLRDDLQPAAAELQFAESAPGYASLRQRLQQIVQRHRAVHFNIRLDAAGQYADNLLHFLHGLGSAGADATRLANVAISISCGDPQRNKNYRAALFGNKKSDAIEARAAARFAVSERPAHTPPLAPELRTLRQVAGRLQAVVRQRTRLINQFHHLLALSFPELALLLKDLAAGWVLELVQRYPTAQLLAGATATEVGTIPYLPDQRIDLLLEHARNSIASQSGAAVAELVRDQVRQLRDVGARQKRLETLLILAFAHLKRQLSMARVLDHLGLTPRLRGTGAQRRCPCPIHRGDGRGRTFSVNLDENVFQCFDTTCGKHGDVIDLWARVKAMSVRQGAIDLTRTFHLEPSPRTGTEKRKG
jgi:hypothetical protein